MNDITNASEEAGPDTKERTPLPEPKQENGEAVAAASPIKDNSGGEHESINYKQVSNLHENVTLEHDLGNYHGILPELDDPIFETVPEDASRARLILRSIENLAPNDEKEKKLLKSMKAPRTDLALNHEDPWEEWQKLKKDHSEIQKRWEYIFGPELPPMNVYELRALIRSVNQRLLYNWSADMPLPCQTDCFDPLRNRYWRRSAEGQWNSYTSSQYRERLYRLGRGGEKGVGGAPSEIASDIEAVTERQAIVTEGISGLSDGVHALEGKLYLAKSGPRPIKPDESIEPLKTLDWLIDLLGEEGAERALDWLYDAVSNFQEGKRTQSRALVIAGPSECGKSYFIREICRQLLGGRAADAAPWLLGTTEFAAELGTAELLYIDDALGDGRLPTRLRTAARLKELVTAGSKPQPIHAKGKDRYYHPVWWRVAVALNDAPEALTMLPPLDEGFGDKVIMLRARPTVLSQRGDKVGEAIQSMQEELPGLMAYLLKRGIKGDVDGRGPLPWQDPVLASKLRETAPEYTLAGMILEMLERRGEPGFKLPIIEPKLTELARHLRDACGERYTRLCPTDRRTLSYLQRLERDGAVSSRAVNGTTRWNIEHLDKWLQQNTDPGQ